MIAAIEAMFYLTCSRKKSLLSFLCQEDGNCDALSQSYHINVHVFGVASSPICSNYAEQKTVGSNKAKYGTEVAETLRNHFFVNDMLKSMSNEKTVIKLI